MTKKILPWQKIVLIFLGLFLALLTLEIGLRVSGFISRSLQEHRNLQSIKKNGEFRIMCLGESTTQNQYPVFLEEILNKSNVGVRFSVIDKGVVGADTTTILGQVESYLDEYHPDMVVTMMGCNDRRIMYYQDIPESDAGLFRYCRVYRFGRILCMLILQKIKREGIYGVDKLESGENPKLENSGAVVRKINLPIEVPSNKVAKSDTIDAKKSPELKNSTLNQSKFLEMETPLRKAVEINPRSDVAHVELGQFYRNQGQFAQAEAAFRKAVEINPRNDITNVKLGQLYQDQGKFLQAEAAFKKALEINPRNDVADLGLGQLYRDQGRFSQAEAVFKKIVEIHPGSDVAHVELGQFYRDRGQFSQAEATFKKAVEINPGNDVAYVKLGLLYRDQDKFRLAEDAFEKALKANSGNDNAYLELGRIYRDTGRPLQAEVAFKKTIEINPRNDFAYVKLARLYRGQDKFPQSEAAFKKAIELNPTKYFPGVELGRLYQDYGKFSEAEAAFKKIIELDPRNENAHRALLVLYEATGRSELGKEYAKKVRRLKLLQYNLATVNNYRKLRKILAARSIRLVCAQYPMRNIGPLKEILGGNEDVIFVDNESIFKDALKKAGSKEYFVDMFGGDFGHCTVKGNQLLAQNIANVILREIFHKR